MGEKLDFIDGVVVGLIVGSLDGSSVVGSSVGISVVGFSVGY